MPKQTIKVDMHFHPNLPKSDGKAIRKARDWWAAFKKAGIDAVIVVEHAYKDPARAYRILLETKPKKAKTEIFPGLEALTSEGNDIVVFDETDKIFQHREICTPYELGTFQLIKKAKKAGYKCFVPHPFTPGTTGVMNNLGERKGKRAIALAGGVELHNDAFAPVLNTPFLPLPKNKLDKMRKVRDLPAHSYTKNGKCIVKFFAGGSDAHEPGDLDAGYLIAAPKKLTRNAIFKAITNNKKGIFMFSKKRSLRKNLGYILAGVYTSNIEWLMKKRLQLKKKLLKAADK